MGCTKYPVLDDGFYLRMMGACADDEERGLVTIFDLTGMKNPFEPKMVQNDEGQEIGGQSGI